MSYGHNMTQSLIPLPRFLPSARTVAILQPHFSLVPFRMLFLCYLFRFVALFLHSTSPPLLLPLPTLPPSPALAARFPVLYLAALPATFLPQTSLLVLFVSLQRCPCLGFTSCHCSFTLTFIHTQLGRMNWRWFNAFASFPYAFTALRESGVSNGVGLARLHYSALHHIH